MTAERVVHAARERVFTIAVAESCTGGLLAAALTEIPGASAVFDRGFVTYSNAAKIEMLGVAPTTLEAHGAVSEAVALEMAAGARARSGAALCIAVTGVAGPGSSDRKPEGRVCFATDHAGAAVAQTVDFGALGRSRVRAVSVDHALELLLRIVAPVP